MTYECPICYSVNHAAKLHCSTCGTTPACYSILGKPSRMIERDFVTSAIPVVNAINASRADRTCYARVYLRTVPADYYATE